MTREDETETVEQTSRGDPAPDSAKQEAASGPRESASGSVGQDASLEEKVAQAQRERAEAHDRYLRSVADLENYRRRSVREREELRQFAIAGVIEDLLPVVDTLGLALQAGRQKGESGTVVEGVAMVLEQLKGLLVKHGLTEVNPAGQDFDPNLHEAVSQQPSAEVPEGKVSQVVRPGYLLNGRLVRPASVVVSSGQPA